jgi:lipoprotein LprG
MWLTACAPDRPLIEQRLTPLVIHDNVMRARGRTTAHHHSHTGSTFMKKTLFALILSGLLLTACGTPDPQIPPAEVITRAGEAMLQTPSFHFKIDISGKLVVLNQLTQLSLRSAEGDFARPDKMGVHLKVLLAIAAAELDMIALGDEQYLTNVLTKQWEVLPPEFGFNPAIMFDPQMGLEQVLKGGLDDARFVGTETIDGKNLWHMQGSLSGERLQGMSGGLISTGPIDVDLWIEPETYLPRKAVIVDKDSDPEKPTTWTMTFSSYGKDVNIAAPELK